MTLATTIRILEPGPSLKDLFDALREIIEIPSDHPYEELTDSLTSEPGGFISALSVTGAGQLSDEDIEEIAEGSNSVGPASWNMAVHLDTTYRARTRHGGCSQVHNYIITMMSAKFPDMKWAADNEFEGTWHINTLPYS
jgi:hypothetical protein